MVDTQDIGISIIVPVGPQKAYRQYLGDCLDTIYEQIDPSKDEILVVDDQHHLLDTEFRESMMGPYIRYIPTPWLLGCAASWNIGVSYAFNDLCLLMGSDDLLLNGAIDALKKSYVEHNHLPAWYNLTIIDSDYQTHSVFNNAAAVTRELWVECGGFPISAGAGAPDALMISIMLVHFPDRLIQVEEGTPYYWCRKHADQDTPRMAGTFNQEVINIRNIETARWQKPTWTKI